MIAIPLTRNFSWRNPPLLTIALILVNCFIFIAFQRDDDRHWEAALEFYFASGLGDLEIEAYDKLSNVVRPLVSKRSIVV